MTAPALITFLATPSLSGQCANTPRAGSTLGLNHPPEERRNPCIGLGIQQLQLRGQLSTFDLHHDRQWLGPSGRRLRRLTRWGRRGGLVVTITTQPVPAPGEPPSPSRRHPGA